MKRGLLLSIALILVLVGFATAQHPICDPDDNASIQGVYINGVCYNCGVSDLVCPEDYGANCGSEGDSDCVLGAEAFWSLDGTSAINELSVVLPDGRDVSLVVTDVSDGESISFDVYEDDGILGFGDDYITTLSATASGGKAIATWTITEDSLNQTDDYEQFYFTANGLSTKDRTDVYKFLNITTSFTGPVITQCADYLDNVSCGEDIENVATGPGQRDDNGCIYFLDWNCMWMDGSCNLGSSETAAEDNEPSCEGAMTEPCVYGQTEKQGNCEGGDDFFRISYSSTQAECEAWETGPIPCPAQVRLPFFSIFNIIASLAIISVIYAFLSRRS